MRGEDEGTWWRRTALFAGATVAATGALALLPFATPGLFGSRLALGLPPAVLLATLGAPLLILIAAAAFARAQLAIDRRYDVAEH